MRVMNLFEETEVEKRKKRNVVVAKPEFKQHMLAPIRALSVEDQVHLLTKCLDKLIPLSAIKKEAALLKQMALLRKKFIQLTNSGSWENSVILFPLHACEVELRKFIALDFTKGPSLIFVKELSYHRIV